MKAEEIAGEFLDSRLDCPHVKKPLTLQRKYCEKCLAEVLRTYGNRRIDEAVELVKEFYRQTDGWRFTERDFNRLADAISKLKER